MRIDWRPARACLHAIVLAWLGGTAASAQEITIRGRVVEGGTGEAVAAATVTLSGAGRAITNPDGVFVFAGLRPGGRTLRVEMIGYRRLEVRLNAQRDTSLALELEIEAVRAAPLDVRARNYTVRGQVREAESNRPVLGAEILTGNRSARTNSSGRYAVRRLPVGRPLVLEVRALGLFPMQAQVDAERDTTVNFLLAADPIGLRMMAMQVEKLEQRTRALPYSAMVISRDELMRRFYNYPVADAIELVTRAMLRQPSCLLLDERPTSMPELGAYLPDEIERIEIIDRGYMVRIYTRVFIQDMIRGRVAAPSIVLTPEQSVCR